MRLVDGLTLVRHFRSVKGLHELVIFSRADGFFGYVGHEQRTENNDIFWAPAESSGIYETADAAERAALAEIEWFREENSN